MIHGEVAHGFEDVRGAFARCFDELGETGAGYVAIASGRVVADLWAAIASSATRSCTSAPPCSW